MKKRFAALLLAFLLTLLPVLSACSNSQVNTDANTGSQEKGDVTSAEGQQEEEAEPTATTIVKDRYADQNMQGYSYKILAIPTDGHFYTQVASGINEVYAEELNGEIINDAIFNRNLLAEDTLNIVIEPVWGSSVDGIRSQLHNEVLAASTEYDSVLNRMDFLGTNMQNGDLLNIKNIATINTDDFWWDRNIVDSFTMFGTKLYWISGDLNIFDDFAAEVIFFNKQLCADNGMEFPYSLVLEGKWTIDRFYEMAKTAERDLNGDGKLVVKDDVVGHCEENDHVKHWMYAMGEKAMDIGEDGTLTTRLQEERQIRAVDKLYNIMVEQAMTYTGSSTEFKTGHILFLGTMLGPIGGLRDMEYEFGVIPMPKLDEEQEHYGEYISNGWCTAFGIPMTNQDPERTGIIMDAICGFSNETLRVALYDILFGAKYVRDAESVEMLDIIFVSKMYDWAVDFSWGGSFQTLYNGIYNESHTSTNNFVSQTAKVMKLINKALEKLVKTVDELEY
jgi:hypothetical protein